jgi:hypothetical protein
MFGTTSRWHRITFVPQHNARPLRWSIDEEELPYRLRQQSLLGEFGRSALQTRDIGQILQRATDDNA